jgi:hypothetical protein
LRLCLIGLWAGCGVSITAAPYNGGPGGPILVVTNAANPFTEFYAEILLAEGLNSFALRGTSAITNTTLTNYDVVVLGEMALSAGQVTTLSNWVYGGGNLIAMRPDKQLTNLLGLVAGSSTLSEGYLLVNTASGPGVGIVGETIQFHGTADRYTLVGAASVATLYSNATAATVNPAVMLRSVGPNGGQAAAFAYDLARSIIYTRQGNPAWAGQERDGQPPMRSDDLFYGGATTDWINLNKVAIPQADEQQRLLANLILSMTADKKLLPRFWYFPHGHRAAVVMTGDDHASTYGGSYAARRFDEYLQLSPPGSSVEDWEAPRCSAYIFTAPYPSLASDAQAAAYQAAGFEISLHLDTGCADYTPQQMLAYFTNQLAELSADYPSLDAPTTHRIHCIAWSGYAAPAEVSLQVGIRMETSYYYWPPGWVADRPGFMTGSGMPMRFATTNGSVIDILQAATQMTDESGQSFPYTINTLLDRALGAEAYYGAFVANMHTDEDAEPEADAILTSALTRGVPIVSTRQLLTWTDARNASSIKSINWTNSSQTFVVEANAAARGLEVMVPIPFGYEVVSVTRDAIPSGYYLRLVKGIPYAFCPATNGNYVVTFAPDITGAEIVQVTPVGGAIDVGVATPVTVTFSEAMNASTLNTSTIVLSNFTGGLVASTLSYNPSTFTAVLTPNSPLVTKTLYTVRVAGGTNGVKDLAGNIMIGDYLSSFATFDPNPPNVIGNTNNGSLIDTLWADGAWINAGRFQASSNVTVSAIRARLVGGVGRYKCAIYTDSGGQPSRLLSSSAEVSNPAQGWQTFPLVSAQTLTNGSFYWLAIWSDAVTAEIYYSSSSSGTLRWNQQAYGAWPDPLSTSGGNSYNYCIYAYGGAVVPLVASNLVAGLVEDAATNLVLQGQGGSGPLTYAILSNPTNGSLGVLNPATGAVGYTPNLNYNGADSFRYTVSDGSQQATGTVSLTVTAVNDAPVALSQNLTNAEDEVLALTLAGSDVDGPVTNFVVVAGPTNGLLSGTAPNLSYSPATNYSGVDSLSFQVDDGSLTSAVATVSLNVMPVNDAPVFEIVPVDVQVVELSLLSLTNRATDGDLPEQTLSYTLLESPTNAVIDPNGVISWTPGEAQGPSTNTFTTRVSDGLASVTNSFVVVVTETNAAPVFEGVPADVQVVELSFLSLTNRATDGDLPEQTLTYTLLESPTNAVIDPNGVIGWTPGEAQGPSTNTFTTRVSDGLASVTNSFVVTVYDLNAPLEILSVAVQDELVRLVWSAIPGQDYWVEYVDALGDTNWMQLEPPVQAEETTMSATNGVGGVAQRFFRVIRAGP